MKKIPPWILFLSLSSFILMIISYFFWDKKIAWDVFHEHLQLYDIAKIVSLVILPESNLIFWPVAYFVSFVYFQVKKLSDSILFIVLSIATSNILTAGVKFLAGRARPYLLIKKEIFGFYPFSTKSAFHAFPSGHATTIFALTTALSFLFPKFRYAFFLLALVLSLSRIFIMDHYLSDIFAGGILSLLTTTFVYKKLATKLELPL